jgi:hypothetical protein
MFGAPGAGSPRPSMSAGFKKFTPSLVRRRLASEHLRAVGDANVFLHHVIARAGGDVIAVGPNAGPRIVGEKASWKFVSMIGAERVRAGAHRVTHGIRSREDRQEKHPALCQLVIPDDGVSTVLRLAPTAEAGEDRIRGHRAPQHHTARAIHAAFLGEHAHRGIDDMHDVIGTDGEAVIGNLRSAQAVETFDNGQSSARSR